MSESPERPLHQPETHPERPDERAEPSRQENVEAVEGRPDFIAEIRREVDSAKRGIAQAVWSEPNRFAAAMRREAPGEVRRFLESFEVMERRAVDDNRN